ncbi:hypothetical protein BGZ74_003516, partial [Mortierella antarctica]
MTPSPSGWSNFLAKEYRFRENYFCTAADIVQHPVYLSYCRKVLALDLLSMIATVLVVVDL